MLACNLADAEKNDYVSERFRRAYAWLRDTDLDRIAVGSYPVGGEDVIANVQEYETAPAKSLRLETHDVFYDVQYVISGNERFGMTMDRPAEFEESRLEEDIAFYAEPWVSSELILGLGDLVVVPPKQGHKPHCAVEAPEAVRKVVVKVRA